MSNGKGSRDRTSNYPKYREEMDRIFGKKMSEPFPELSMSNMECVLSHMVKSIKKEMYRTMKVDFGNADKKN